MNDISGNGLRINLIASVTFPIGINLTQFSDDSDPLDIPSLQIADSAMGLNGDLIFWSKANPIKPSLSVIAESDDDIVLSILMEANRVGRGKSGAKDILTMTALYPTGRFITFINGVITDGNPANAVASAGRIKTKLYSFAFENKIGA